ncbi:gamma-soluble NSF attachment protein [Frankliniella occidentalis]|uniref:Gamma-soluble NSF attachment protein n=1 Tax=Frankliniella occidentalis TaxID=133901 RepID=A0A6J1TD80_FRAOC|nr:gamma-soluble NSF attachment protein [Frankliniella occidentalis]
MSKNPKIEEGLECIRNAEKCLKTSLLKWRPDYDSAADEYNRAATCFRNARSFQQCKDCLFKAADCYKQNRSFFHAAKCLEQAMLMSRDLGNLLEVASLAEKACSLYQQHGSSESGALALDKAAKIIEEQHPEEALKLNQHAADVAMTENNVRQSAEFVGKVSRILVKLKRYDQAADAIRREMGLHEQSEHVPAIGRLAVALVLVQLARGDYVAAEKAFKEWGNCCEAPEVQTLEMLLQGFDEEDSDTVKRALNSPFIKHMDVEYARLARELPLPQPTTVAPKATVRENAAPSYVSPNASSQTASAQVDFEESGQSVGEHSAPAASSVAATTPGSEDEYEGGLC